MPNEAKGHGHIPACSPRAARHGTRNAGPFFALISNPVWIAVDLAIGAALGVTYHRISSPDADDDSDD